MASMRDLERTMGDGMEDTSPQPQGAEINPANTVYKHLYPFKSTSNDNNPSLKTIPITFKPIEPQSQVFNLVPKYIPKERKQPKYLTRKEKEPKFVPYEPYKAAVEPMTSPQIPQEMKKPAIKKIAEPSSSGITPRNNNVEITELVAQMSDFRCAELSKDQFDGKGGICDEVTILSRKEWEKEKSGYQNDIKNLRESNSHLENQLKFQAQVNSELKTLLVAAVGEDLESRVQHLTEDKLQLARALLKSANHLTSHQEQTEWLSGQCEVWRSKFLASSLMVEELAHWKSALTTRMNDLQTTLKQIMDEKYKVQKTLLQTHTHLSAIVKHLDHSRNTKISNSLNSNSNVVSRKSSPNVNFIDIVDLNCNLSEQVCVHLTGAVGGTGSDRKEGVNDCLPFGLSVLSYTNAERTALRLLQNPVRVQTNKQQQQDAICSALVGTAVSLNGEQMYLQHPSTRATCCSHCTGEVKDI